MKKSITLLLAFTIVIIMICGCAKKETDVVIVGSSEAAAANKTAINSDKPAETVERAPDQVAETQKTAEATEAPAGDAQAAKAEAKAPEAANQAATEAPAPTQASADTQAATQAPAEGDLVSNDYSQYAGKYIRTDDGSYFALTKDGKVDISITRLTQMDGKAEGIYKNVIKITAKDANDGDMKLEFLTDTNELVVTGSTWSLLPNGETFKFDKKE